MSKLSEIREEIAHPDGPPTQRVQIDLRFGNRLLTGAADLADADLLALLDLLESQGFELTEPYGSEAGFGR